MGAHDSAVAMLWRSIARSRFRAIVEKICGSAMRLAHVKFGAWMCRGAPAPFRALTWAPSLRGQHRMAHARDEQDRGSSGRGGQQGALWMVLAGTAGGYLLYTFTRKDPGHTNEPRISTVLMTPPETFEHPLNCEPFLVRFWVATKRILFLLRCFTPLAFVTVIYLLHGTPEKRAHWINVLVGALESAGCTFQKFGQWMSMRPDMLPPDVILALSRLRDDVPQHDMAHNRAIFRANFGVELEEVFSRFDAQPIASGTVAQGKERDVAVKVRHPHVVAETFVDIDLIFSFINTLGEVAGHLTIPFKKHEFHSVLQRQIDFRWEAHNLFRFAHNFRNDAAVRFPEVLEEFYSPSVLVECWVNGRTITDLFTELTEGFAINAEADRVGPARAFDPAQLAQKRGLAVHLFDATMKMFLRDNFIHGDLHAGNVLFCAQSPAPTVIDTGVVTSIEEAFAAPFASFLLALCRGDTQELSDRLIQFNQSESFDDAAFRSDIQATTKRWVGAGGRAPDGGLINLGDLVGEILFKIQKHHLSLRGDVASTIVTMSLVEGLVKQLDPDFDIVGSALPYFQRYYPGGVRKASG